jgi:hypothetical protein
LQELALSRLLQQLMAQEAAALWQLHSHELAQLAAAAAAIQQAMAAAASRDQERHQQPPASSDLGSSSPPRTTLLRTALPGKNSSSSSSAKQVPGNGAAPLLPPVPSLRGSAASSGARLALLSPMERLWPLLERVALQQLPTFSAASLSSLAHSFASSSQASHQLMLSVCNAALAKPHKFDMPESIVPLLQALTLSGLRGQLQLLEALCSQLAANKATFSPLQLVEAITALEQLPYYNEQACLAVCKAASRSTKRWPSGLLVRLMVCLAKLRYRDELLLQAAVKQLTLAGVPQLSGAELGEVLWALLQLGFDSPVLEQLVAAAIGWVCRCDGTVEPCRA